MNNQELCRLSVCAQVTEITNEITQQEPNAPIQQVATSNELLVRKVKSFQRFGCEDWTESLGIVPMPGRYALMLNSDRTHLFWLRRDGAERVEHCDKWAIYRGASFDPDKAQ